VSEHSFKPGQIVRFLPGRSSLAATSPEYKIVRLLPPEGGQNLYRIKGVAETFERMARESDLSRKP
jgi:hypothetical protein